MMKRAKKEGQITQAPTKNIYVNNLIKRKYHYIFNCYMICILLITVYIYNINLGETENYTLLVPQVGVL